jgi:hypothetical protein
VRKRLIESSHQPWKLFYTARTGSSIPPYPGALFVLFVVIFIGTGFGTVMGLLRPII